MKYSKWDIGTLDLKKRDELILSGISKITASVLCSRGIDTPQKAAEFLSVDKTKLNDPFMLHDMDRAVDRIRLAKSRNEKIAVYGDYDVDGVTSVSICVKYFRDMGFDCDYYVPGRFDDGYGLNKNAISKLYDKGVSLLITVDTGITAFEEVQFARSLGMDVVVTDHHECKDELPDAIAVVNPRRKDCSYPFKEFAGVGVAFKLLCALENNSERILEKYGDLVSIGTIADIMEITGENRVIVAEGIKKLKRTENLGLNTLIHESCAKDKRINTDTVGFILAPRINASGRMGTAGMTVELFLTEDEKRARELVENLIELNRQRQRIETEIYTEAYKLAKEEIQRGKKAIILKSDAWHQGVIGIVASKLSEKFGCPTLLVCMCDGRGKGSGRSVTGFNLYQALSNVAHTLVTFGGHEQAAGFTVDEENFEAMKREFNSYCEGVKFKKETRLSIDCKLQLDELDVKSIKGICELEPFGLGNSQPVFVAEKVELKEAITVGDGKHLKVKLASENMQYNGIFFGINDETLGLYRGDIVDVAYTPEINYFNGRENISVNVSDIRIAGDVEHDMRRDFELCLSFLNDEEIDAEQAKMLLPERDEFAVVWRALKKRGSDFKINIYRFAKEISDISPSVTYMKCIICLNVFEQCGLIECTAEDKIINVKVKFTTGKIELGGAKTVIKLRKIMRAENV